jgi:hypothetical protein
LVQKIGRNLEGSRTRAVERLSAKDIELNRVERVIGRAAKDWTAPDIAKVVAMLQSIEDGMTTSDDAFPSLEKDKPADSPAVGSTPATRGEPDDQGDAGVRATHQPTDDDAGVSPGAQPR